jgi:hypothetical protein
MKIFKYILVTLSLVLVVLSCKKEVFPNSESSTTSVKTAIVDYSNLHVRLNSRFTELNKVTDKKLVTYDWYMSRFDKDVAKKVTYEQLANLHNQVKSQISIAKGLGFFNYLDFLRNENKISSGVSTFISTIYVGINNCTEKGDFNEISVYKLIDNAVANTLQNSILNVEEINKINLAAEVAKSVCIQLVQHSQSKFLCSVSTQGVAIVATVAIVLGDILNPEESLLAIIVTNGVVAVFDIYCFLGETIWNWISGIFSSAPDCHPPTGIGYELIDCQTARISAGAGSDAILTSFSAPGGVRVGNTNAVDVPILSGSQSYSFMFKCKNGNDIVPITGNYDFAAIRNLPPPDISIINFPASIIHGQAARFSASASTHGIYTLTWSVSSSAASIAPTNSAGYSADITFFYSSDFTITATLKNNCTGAKSIATKTVHAN